MKNARPAKQILQNEIDSSLPDLLQKAKKWSDLNYRLQFTLPMALRSQIRLSNIHENGRAVFVVENSSIAHQARFYQHEILQKIQKLDQSAKSIKIKVMPVLAVQTGKYQRVHL